jgi:spore coat protein CotH
MIFDPATTLLTIKNQPQTGLYDIDSLQTIYIEFSQTNWWQLLTQNYQSKEDIPADLIYNGIRYENVGIRFRGQTSYQKIQKSKKKSFNISIDYLDSNQRLEGYKTLNLNNSFEDPSFMREALYMALAGEHVPTAKCNFVKLVINSENWGVYSNVQQLNKDFFNEWFTDKNGSIWRAEYPDTSSARPGPGGGQPSFGEGYCSLNYLDSNYLTYTRYYTLKASEKEIPWYDLMNTCYMLNKLPVKNLYDSLQHYLDVDRSLWQIANEIIFTDDDSYVNKGGMDYYVYWDSESGRIQPIDYDGNSTFNSRNLSWSPFIRENNIKFPLVNRLLQNNDLKQRYVAHFRTILDSIFIPEKVEYLSGKFRTLIETEVDNDTKKLYTMSQFNSSISELKSFVTTRRNQ